MFKSGVAGVLALAGLAASTISTFAMSGIGCPDLPAYYRAIGTLQMGPGPCAMTTEEAKRILSQQRGPSDSPQYRTQYPK